MQNSIRRITDYQQKQKSSKIEDELAEIEANPEQLHKEFNRLMLEKDTQQNEETTSELSRVPENMVITKEGESKDES